MRVSFQIESVLVVKMRDLILIVMSLFCVVCRCRVPTCDDIDRMKTEIQQMVDGERSMIPTAVRFGKTILSKFVGVLFCRYF